MGFLEHYGRVTGRSDLLRTRARWVSRRSPAYYWGALAHRLMGRDIARERLVASLSGEARAELEAAARTYADDVLPAFANSEIHAALAEHRAKGDRIMILSSSLDLVVAPIADSLRVEFAASSLGFEDGRCTGRIEQDLTGQKAHVADEQRRIEGGQLVVYTDNRSDRALIDLADRATVVLPRRARSRWWAGDGVQYVRL